MHFQVESGYGSENNLINARPDHPHNIQSGVDISEVSQDDIEIIQLGKGK